MSELTAAGSVSFWCWLQHECFVVAFFGLSSPQQPPPLLGVQHEVVVESELQAANLEVPSAHWQTKCGEEASSVEAAVAHTTKLTVILRTRFMMSPVKQLLT